MTDEEKSKKGLKNVTVAGRVLLYCMSVQLGLNFACIYVELVASGII